MCNVAFERNSVSPHYNEWIRGELVVHVAWSCLVQEGIDAHEYRPWGQGLDARWRGQKGQGGRMPQNFVIPNWHISKHFSGNSLA